MKRFRQQLISTLSLGESDTAALARETATAIVGKLSDREVARILLAINCIEDKSYKQGKAYGELAESYADQSVKVR